MRISFGDTSFKRLRSQSGQGIVEYILVLFVAVAIILGGIYQLNDAFRVWAENYFGNYLACLLETGELPSIGGTPGDSGTCNQLFEPFSLGKGRKLKMPSGGSSSGGQTAQGSTRGTNESSSSRGSGGYNYAGGGGRNGSGGWAGGGGRGSSSQKLNSRKPGSNDKDQSTGSTAVSSSGGGYRSGQNVKRRQQSTLDNGFAFDDEQDGKPKRQRMGGNSTPGGDSRTKNRIPIRIKPPAKIVLEEDAPMTFSNFIRILLIAAIIIALVLFIGGQVLQMGKNME